MGRSSMSDPRAARGQDTARAFRSCLRPIHDSVGSILRVPSPQETQGHRPPVGPSVSGVSFSKLGLGIALALTLAYAALNAYVKPVVWSDSGFGLLAWDSRHDLPFNEAAHPDSRDISKVSGGFVVAWSPGQYLLPGWLEAAGLSLGSAIVAVVTVASLLGLWGWWRLYRAFGFPEETAAIALAIIAATRHFSAAFGIYVGGEPLLFAAAPWFMLLVWRLSGLQWRAVLPLVAATAVMFFAKLNGIILAAAAVGAAAVSPPMTWNDWRTALRKGAVASTSIGIAGTVFYLAWYRHGWTAATPGDAFHWADAARMAVLGYSSAWGASLSLGELGNYLFLNPNRPLLASPIPAATALAVPATLTFYLVWRRLAGTHAKYLRFTALTALAYCLVLVWIRWRGGMIGEEERYFRVVSLMLFIGIVQTMLDVRASWLRISALGIALLSVSYGIASQISHLVTHQGLPLGIRAFRHSTASSEVIDFIRRIDVASPDRQSTLVYVTSPEIALEVRNVRVMTNHADFGDPKDLARVEYRGRVPHLYFIVQNKLIADGKAGIMLRSFRDYPVDGWQQIPLGNFAAFYAAN